MLTLIDWILNLFRSEDAARAFVAAPEQALRDAGLAGVTRRPAVLGRRHRRSRPGAGRR